MIQSLQKLRVTATSAASLRSRRAYTSLCKKRGFGVWGFRVGNPRKGSYKGSLISYCK